MKSLLTNILPWGLAGVGSLMLLGGIATLFSEEEKEATRIDIAEIESDDLPDKEWLSVQNGYFNWEYCLQVALEGSEDTGGTYFVPVTSGPNTVAAGGRGKAGLVVKMSRKDAETFLEKQVDRDGKILTETLVESIDFKGLKKSDFAIDSLAKDYGAFGLWLSSHDEVHVVELGLEPMTKGAAGGMVVVSLLMVAGGVFWIRKRRNDLRAAQAIVADHINTPEYQEAIKEGMQAGIESAMRKAVGDGVDRAFERAK